MGFIAIAGCGALGGTLAHKLAGRDRVAEIRLIDPEGRIAQGKALDILQSSPVERFSTRITSADAWTAAAGADLVVLADDGVSGKEHAGESGLMLVRQLVSVSGAAPIVFAGAGQRELIGRASSELRVPRRRLLGSAPLALESAVRALAGVLLDTSGVDVAAADRGRSAERGSGGVGRSRCIGTAAVEPTASTSDRDAHLEDPEPLAAGAVRARLCGVARGRRTARPLQATILVLRGAGARCAAGLRRIPTGCACCRDAGGARGGGCETGAGAVADTTGADAARERDRNVRALEMDLQGGAFPPPRARTQARCGETSP